MIAKTPCELPRIRACLFDMDGLLLDTEDLYTHCNNLILKEYGRPNLPWKIKAQLQGRPAPDAAEIFHAWAKLPISREEFNEKQKALQTIHFPTAQPLPGVPALLERLCATADAPSTDQPRVYLALATSSHAHNFRLKTTHHKELFSAFPAQFRLVGDDPRIPAGRGKPCPDIYLLALDQINKEIRSRNESRKELVNNGSQCTQSEEECDEAEISPAECLVFEDSVPGVEAGRRAGMRVIWCPHPELLKLWKGKEDQVLNAMTSSPAGTCHAEILGQGDAASITSGDGWAELVTSLELFAYGKYGIHV